MDPGEFEKLGVFYLGRLRSPDGRSAEAAPLLYDSRDLTTHAVCVGMTGSGKTGLCIDLIEEAAIDGVPAIAIDPKGDLGNLLLTFPELRPEDFRPWIEEEEARRKGLDPDTVLGALFGRRSLGGATTATRGVGRSIEQAGDVGRAAENVETLRRELTELDAELQAEIRDLEARIEPQTEPLTAVSFRPEKGDVSLRLVALGWLPWWTSPGGDRVPARADLAG